MAAVPIRDGGEVDTEVRTPRGLQLIPILNMQGKLAELS
jgi:hypothetical protein